MAQDPAISPSNVPAVDAYQGSRALDIHTWQIADVYLNGTISELATRRSEFAAILRTRGINGLIAMLNTKADALSARAS